MLASISENAVPAAPEDIPVTDEPTTDPRWPDVLDRLEDGIAEALTAMDRPATSFDAELWLPPADMGPLPPELKDRVEKLMEAGAVLNIRMMAAQENTIKRLAAVASVPKNAPVSKPVYLDVQG